MDVSWDFISSSSTKVWACSLACLASVWHLCWSYQLSETFHVNIKFNNLMAHYASSEKSTSTGTEAGVLKQAVQWVCVQRDAQHCQYDIAEIENQHIKNHKNGSVHCFHSFPTWNSNFLIMWSVGGFKQSESRHMTEGTESAHATGHLASLLCSRGPDRLNHISNYQQGPALDNKGVWRASLTRMTNQWSHQTECLEEMLLPYFFPSPSL